MRQSTAALQTFLLARLPCKKADLFTFTLANGSINRWTDYDRPVTYSATTWIAQGPLLTRSSLNVKNTVQVPSLVIKLAALDTDFVGGASIKSQLHNGIFAGAQVQLDRVFMPSPGDTSLGPVTLFAGDMGPIKVTALGAELTVRGANVRMNQFAPRNLYQPGCNHAFCDMGCTLNRATYTTAYTVGAAPTPSKLTWAAVPASPGLYTFGSVTMTSGACIGQVRTIKFANAAGIILSSPFYGNPAPGDTFTAFQGCDKQYSDGTGQSCADRGNTQHYRGFKNIPPAETAL